MMARAPCHPLARLLSLALVPWCAAPAAAQGLVCTSSSYCEAGAMACTSSVFPLTVTREGDRATLRWDDGQPFAGEVRRDSDPLVIAALPFDGSPFMLVVGDRGDGAFSTATDFGDYMIAGFYTLTCSRTP